MAKDSLERAKVDDLASLNRSSVPVQVVQAEDDTQRSDEPAGRGRWRASAAFLGRAAAEPTGGAHLCRG
jgi:hypothetical protein